MIFLNLTFSSLCVYYIYCIVSNIVRKEHVSEISVAKIEWQYFARKKIMISEGWNGQFQGDKKFEKTQVVYNCFFCGNLSSNDAPTWCHFVCSLKKEDVGYCKKLSGVRESVFFAESAGEEKESNCILLTSMGLKV